MSVTPPAIPRRPRRTNSSTEALPEKGPEDSSTTGAETKEPEHSSEDVETSNGPRVPRRPGRSKEESFFKEDSSELKSPMSNLSSELTSLEQQLKDAQGALGTDVSEELDTDKVSSDTTNVLDKQNGSEKKSQKSSSSDSSDEKKSSFGTFEGLEEHAHNDTEINGPSHHSAGTRTDDKLTYGSNIEVPLDTITEHTSPSELAEETSAFSEKQEDIREFPQNENRHYEKLDSHDYSFKSDDNESGEHLEQNLNKDMQESNGGDDDDDVAGSVAEKRSTSDIPFSSSVSTSDEMSKLNERNTPYGESTGTSQAVTLPNNRDEYDDKFDRRFSEHLKNMNESSSEELKEPQIPKRPKKHPQSAEALSPIELDKNEPSNNPIIPPRPKKSLTASLFESHQSGTEENEDSSSDLNSNSMSSVPTHVRKSTSLERSGSEASAEIGNDKMAIREPFVPPRPRKKHEESSSEEKIKVPPPKPKKLSSKIAAFQKLFNDPGPSTRLSDQELTSDSTGQASLNERSKLSSEKIKFAQNLNLQGVMGRGIPLPGMARPPSPREKHGGNEVQPSISNVTENKHKPRARGPKGKRLPKALKDHKNLEIDSKFRIIVLDLWDIKFPLKDETSLSCSSSSTPVEDPDLGFSDQTAISGEAISRDDSKSSEEDAENNVQNLAAEDDDIDKLQDNSEQEFTKNDLMPRKEANREDLEKSKQEELEDLEKIESEELHLKNAENDQAEMEKHQDDDGVDILREGVSAASESTQGDELHIERTIEDDFDIPTRDSPDHHQSAKPTELQD